MAKPQTYPLLGEVIFQPWQEVLTLLTTRTLATEATGFQVEGGIAKAMKSTVSKGMLLYAARKREKRGPEKSEWAAFDATVQIAVYRVHSRIVLGTEISF